MRKTLLLFLLAAQCETASAASTSKEVTLDIQSLTEFSELFTSALFEKAATFTQKPLDPHELKPPGPYFSAAAFPFSGILLRDGAIECSGALIAPNLFLTAAHCVCENPQGGYFQDAKSCKANPEFSHHATAVFIPSVGVVSATAAPTIGDDYHFLAETDQQIDLGSFPTGMQDDLALIRLDKRIVSIALPSLTPRAGVPVFFGFGQTYISGDPKKTPFRLGIMTIFRWRRSRRRASTAYRLFPISYARSTTLKIIRGTPTA